MIDQATKDYIHEHRNEIGKCPVCNGNIKDRTISIYAGILKSLYEVYKWCGQKGVHEFQMKDVRHLLDKNDYNRFNDLIKLSNGVVYRPEGGKSWYGLNMVRLKEFYKGERPMKIQIVKDQITNETVAETFVYFYEVPALYEYLDINGVYDHEKVIVLPNNIDRYGKKKLETVEDYQLNLSI